MFHTPVLDESVTTYVDGFNPDGSTAQISFNDPPPFPFLHLRYDDDFFIKPENIPTGTDPEVAYEPRRHLWEAVFEVMRVGRAYVHRPSGHSESCYNEYEIDGVGLWWAHDHEGQHNDDDPEMKTRVWLEYKYDGVDHSYVLWDPKKYKHLYDADRKKEWNNLSPRPRFYWHSYKDCGISSWNWHSVGDHATFEVWENDHYPNPDDEVGKWVQVPSTVGMGDNYETLMNNLNPRSDYLYTVSPWPADARLRFQIGHGGED